MFTALGDGFFFFFLRKINDYLVYLIFQVNIESRVRLGLEFNLIEIVKFVSSNNKKT